MVDLIAFISGTGILAWLSRKPLARPGSHGFYRFFAWECILALVILNRHDWGSAPFSPHQLLSWALMTISIGLVVAGLRALRRQGGQNEDRGDAALYAWEKTGALVTDGIFRWLRHPMYASLLALTWGAFCQSPGWPGAVIALIGSACLLATAQADEQECLAHFGPAYADYMARSKRFVPGLF